MAIVRIAMRMAMRRMRSGGGRDARRRSGCGLSRNGRCRVVRDHRDYWSWKIFNLSFIVDTSINTKELFEMPMPNNNAALPTYYLLP